MGPNHRFNPLPWCRTARTAIRGMRAKKAKQETLGRFLRHQDGVIAAWVAVSLVLILGFASLAIDMSYAYSTRNMLQVTASAAALAAAPELPDQSQAVAKALEYVEENMPAANHGMVLDSNDVVFGHWDTGTETWTPLGSPINAVGVITRRAEVNDNRLDLSLAQVLGLPFLNIQTSAVAYFKGASSWDVALVQDVTGTFIDEIEDAKLADQALLDCISNTFASAQMGLTTFTGTAPTLANPESPPHILVPMAPVGIWNGNNYDALSLAISEIQIPPWQNTWQSYGTHVGIGIESAIDQLDNYVPSSGITGQAIIIVGDGRPQAMGNSQGFYPESEYYGVCGSSCSSNELGQMAVLAADEAFTKGYDVFAIFYDEQNDDTASDFYESLIRGNGTYQRVPNSEDLADEMIDLCGKARVLQLVM